MIDCIDKKRICMALLAHVDAGKTTLSEALLYSTGVIKNLGRVDNKNSYLDVDDMEKNRGITIFSKQAVFDIASSRIYLLDTPGHVDFSAEMERTLQVLDYAILVISASDGIQGHTKTLWKLLKQYNIPTFIFFNKMDQTDMHKDDLLGIIKKELGASCIDFSNDSLAYDDLEQVAVSYAEYCDESFLDDFLMKGNIEEDIICEAISKRLIFPCYFGSALKLFGIEELIYGIDKYTKGSYCSEESFGAKVYKITRDTKNERLVHMKITNGSLRIKDKVNDEKVNQIRIYNGLKYENMDVVYAGDICSVTGLNEVVAGDCLGVESNKSMKLLEPVLSYQIIVPKDVSARQIYPKIKEIEEELPELSLVWDEVNEEIKVKLMGQIQIEILKEMIKSRLGISIEFGLGSISYKETIKASSIGVGHFEPLRHYAEIHLNISEGPRGSGVTVESDVSEDILDKNWQRLVKTHILEKVHKGVLTGSPLTDVKISIINGRAHQKHTEGGDFRQATYRAIRNGLMYAESILLEPMYNFELTIPSNMVGKAILDIENMHGNIQPPEIDGEIAVIIGKCPVATMRDYQVNVNSYTKGNGSLIVDFAGYDVCHNQDEIVESVNYNPDLDNNNPSSSVFCAHGSGFIVPWYEVRDYMHLEIESQNNIENVQKIINREAFDYAIGNDEIDEILGRTYNANVKSGKSSFKKKREVDYFDYSKSKAPHTPKEKIYILDGYNLIFAWEDLKELSKVNIDSAKDKLISIISDYMAIIDTGCIIVFDGYKVKNNMGSEEIKESISVIHTKEGETADTYIERYANTNKYKYNITVVTSDSLIRQLATGSNCHVINSKNFQNEVYEAKKLLRETYNLD